MGIARVDPNQLLAISRDRGVGLDQKLAGVASPLEGCEGFGVSPECDERSGVDRINPGRGRGKAHERRIDAARLLENVLSPGKGFMGLACSTGVCQLDSHVAEVPCQLVAHVWIVSICLEERLALHDCLFVGRSCLVSAACLFQSQGQGPVRIRERSVERGRLRLDPNLGFQNRPCSLNGIEHLGCGAPAGREGQSKQHFGSRPLNLAAAVGWIGGTEIAQHVSRSFDGRNCVFVPADTDQYLCGRSQAERESELRLCIGRVFVQKSLEEPLSTVDPPCFFS